MKIAPEKITIRELVEGYRDSPYSGVRGYGDRLDIRPAYQREMIYSAEQQVAVIESVLDGFPIGVMYWAKNKSTKPMVDYEYEVIDGQQRTISLCQYVVLDKYQVRGQLFSALDEATKNKILDYEILVYFCEGTPDETLAWFERINIAGEPLTKQELRNASYTGAWLASAKEYFRCQGPAQELYSDYFKALPDKGEWNRWGGLELAIKWAVEEDGEYSTIEEYMGAHRNDDDAEELWETFENVFLWIEEIFPPEKNKEDKKKRGPLLKKVGQQWHKLYQDYKDDEYDPDEVEARLVELFADDEIDPKQQHKIFVYIITGDEKDLQFRLFPDEMKAQMYAEQKHRCPVCYGLGKLDEDEGSVDLEYEYNEMEGDHIQPWSQGGKTEYENLAMLCKQHNSVKSDMKWRDVKKYRDELRNLPEDE